MAAPAAAPPLRLLYVARENVFSLPGGDTEVLLALRRDMEARGHRVDFASHKADPEGYDLVHIFNTEPGHALNLALRGAPFVMTPLYEDPGYVDDCLAVYRTLRQALVGEDSGAGPGDDPGTRGTRRLADIESRLPPPASLRRVAPTFDQGFALRSADLLLCVGPSEAGRLMRDFDGVRTRVVPLGLEGEGDGDGADPEIFARSFGVRDYVLCVGRLEMRKNQLGLLHALRDLDRPLVFVNSRTHMEDYEKLCRDWPRRGPVVFTGRLSRSMLRSAFAGAAVHALPSFFELPGLVTLEAAALGARVVAGRPGALVDYLPRGVFFCDPRDPRSIRTAVEQALEQGVDGAPAAAAREFTWERTARETEAAYRSVLAEAETAAGRDRRHRVQSAARDELDRRARLAAALTALEKADYPAALEAAAEAADRAPADPGAWFIAGEAALKAGRHAAALAALDRCRDLDPRHGVRLHIFRSLACAGSGDTAGARAALEEGLAVWPSLPAAVEALFRDHLGRCAAAQGDPKEWKRQACLRRRLVPEDASAVLAWARILTGEGQVNEAVEAARKWAGVDPGRSRDEAGPACRCLSMSPAREAPVLVLGADDDGALATLIASLAPATALAVLEPDAGRLLRALARVTAVPRGLRIFLAARDARGEIEGLLRAAARAGLSPVVHAHPGRLAEEAAFFAELAGGAGGRGPLNPVVAARP